MADSKEVPAAPPLCEMVARRVKRISISQQEKKPVRCSLNRGPAPLHGATLYLTPGGTLPFELAGQRGRYDGNGAWHPLP